MFLADVIALLMSGIRLFQLETYTQELKNFHRYFSVGESAVEVIQATLLYFYLMKDGEFQYLDVGLVLA